MKSQSVKLFSPAFPKKFDWIGSCPKNNYCWESGCHYCQYFSFECPWIATQAEEYDKPVHFTLYNLRVLIDHWPSFDRVFDDKRSCPENVPVFTFTA